MTPTPAKQTRDDAKYIRQLKIKTAWPDQVIIDHNDRLERIAKSLTDKDAVIERLVEALNLAVRQMTIEDMLLPEEPHLRSALGVAKSALTFAKEHGAK